MSEKAKHKVFINIYKLALEFSKSNELILNELSHYLVDNLISKICISIAQERDLKYQKTTKRGNTKTYDFPSLYKEILMKAYPNIPDYEKDIQELHDLRNLFQHGSESLTLGVRPEMASEYVRLTEIILREIGIIKEDETIEPTNYLKAQFLKDRSEVEYPADTGDYIEEETMNYMLEELEEDFDLKISAKGVKSDLNMNIKAYPLRAKEDLFQIREISELKNYLERETRTGPPFDGFPTPLFFELTPNREGLEYIAPKELVGSILVQRAGIVIYEWRYGMKKDPDKETLPVHLMASYVLGFLYFLSKFFSKVNYLNRIRISLSISNLPNWKYSREPKFVFNRPKHDFKQSSFRPFERVIPITNLNTKHIKQMILQEIFDEVLLCYGDSNGYNLPESLKTYLEEH